MLAAVVAATMTTPAYAQAKSGCQDNPPKLFLESNKIEVRNISVDGHVHAMKHITHDCYDQFSRREKHKSPWMNMTKFTISSTKNKFTGIGCDTYATIEGYRDGKSYMTGCMSICTSTDYVRNGWCSGIGCCQTSIPEGLNNFKKRTKFNFSSYYLTHLGNETELPIVLDWAIENVTCGVAKNSIRYACMNNTECHDITDGTGYRCSCLEGYKGNPYLPGTGCQDVDECKNPELNQCEKLCSNTLGSYNCFCPKGYHGDGRKYGIGCIADRLLVTKMKIVVINRKEEIVAVAQLAHRCLNLNGKKRPPMKEVAGELDRIRKLQQNSMTQPYYEIVENNTTRHSEARDVASSSTGTESDSTTSIASSFDAMLTQPTIRKTT
ncbi:hypothetical protein Acr_21g0004650 [Actinidia rufa]|uniref:EGF-like domain-containing protein n=1 Tax=Actinidia rufa TaxID=165716 RepID=A0A7J0GGD8_9ERIC|nr:hypothetical protein Acr_21g0004650 [Actinidia rufa]